MRKLSFSWRPGGLRWEESRTAIILLLPAVLGIVVFSFIPIAQALSTSFYDAPLLSRQRTFIGLDNYTAAFHDPVFIKSLVNTVLYAGGTLVLQVTLALGLPLLIRDHLPGISFFRSASFLPVVTSLVIVSTVWQVLYNSN